MMISGFMEGLDIIPGTSAGDMFGNASTYMGNGNELIRQLTREYSLRSRAECLSLRMQLVGKTFVSHGSDSPVADIIRQIEYSIARYMRLMCTVQGVEDLSGLRIEDGDTLSILVRSLPTEVRNYMPLEQLMVVSKKQHASLRINIGCSRILEPGEVSLGLSLKKWILVKARWKITLKRKIMGF